MSPRAYKNRLLQQFSERDAPELKAHFELVPLEARFVLVRANAKIQHVYFPESTPLQATVQIPGEAYRIDHDLLDAQAKISPELSYLFRRFDQYTITRVSYIALSHGSFTVRERLARWLLMAQDRVGADIPLVHDFFAWTLSVRRASVTIALRELKERNSIETARGLIKIVDRDALLELAGGSYGHAEAEYARLLGVDPTKFAARPDAH